MKGIQKLTNDGIQLTNQKDIANAFNKYLSSVNSESNGDNLGDIGYNNFSTYSNSQQGRGISVPVWFLNLSLQKDNSDN
jgi:hypothetical protein